MEVPVAVLSPLSPSTTPAPRRWKVLTPKDYDADAVSTSASNHVAEAVEDDDLSDASTEAAEPQVQHVMGDEAAEPQAQHDMGDEAAEPQVQHDMVVQAPSPQVEHDMDDKAADRSLRRRQREDKRELRRIRQRLILPRELGAIDKNAENSACLHGVKRDDDDGLMIGMVMGRLSITTKMLQLSSA